MTTVSQTCRWIKCTRIDVLVAKHPGHPSTGQFCGPPAVGKVILYIRGSSPGAVADQLLLPYSDLPFCVYMCPAINPSTISSLHSLHCTLPLYRSWYEGPSPVICLPYTTSDCAPAAWHRRQTMPNVLPKLVRRPTLSNRPTKVLKNPWSHCGSNDATIPSSVHKRALLCPPSCPCLPRSSTPYTITDIQ